MKLVMTKMKLVMTEMKLVMTEMLEMKGVLKKNTTKNTTTLELWY